MDDQLYDTLFPRYGRKIVLLAEVPLHQQELLLSQSTGYKPERILGVMNAAAELLKKDPDATSFLSAPVTTNRERFGPLSLRFDGLEYEGAIFKNLRRSEGKEIFELKLPNDGFFYKSTSDPSFVHGGASSSTRKRSQAWFELTRQKLDFLKPGVAILASLFGFADEWNFQGLYNSEIMSMELIVTTPSDDRELTITFEQIYLIAPRPSNVNKFSYSQLRKDNLEGAWGSDQ